MESGHPETQTQTHREPITVSLVCNYELKSSLETKGIVELPSHFEREVKETIGRLDGHDKIVIELKIGSTHESTINEAGQVQAPQVDARQLERILSAIYTLVEHEKSARDELMMLQVDVLIAGFSQSSPSNHRPPFRALALGGTFDHLHSGHKILLTIACWLTAHTLIVGITDDELLKKKKYAEELEGVNERRLGVEKFIERVSCKNLKIELPILHDIYGPTATEEEIDGLLVTQETVSGADSIDELRVTNGLKPLTRYVIDVIAPSPLLQNHPSIKDLKISSTHIRAWLHRFHHSH